MNPNRLVRTVSLALAALCLPAALPARAAEGHGGGAGTVYPKDDYPYAELVKRPLTLSAGIIQLDVPVESNLSKDEVGKPWSIPLSLDFGLSDDLTIGVFHQTGLCFAGTSNGCERVYDDLGARATLGILRDPGGQLALRAAVLAQSLKDSLYAGSIGAAYKRTLGNLALVLGVDYVASLTKRDERSVKDELAGDAELQLQIAEGLAAFGRIGYTKFLGEAAGVDLGYWVPVGFGVEFEPVSRLDVGVDFTFDNLLGKDGTADERSGRVFVRLFL
ncbi:hypothetical protein [Anaeromyxobacter oryzae]|uniref:Outer membrane protein beta-barrel domain-containing protein n=1 Tax=Anaeromyxobacter oryzae TaxID=2918170 RepID=A0ABM7X4J8_9BACT|nr:hypothetical protein [Anaeromyxobacter oryzae]BDG06723.1 hypothetical protein AMOR_57190 [Anaeromyxobacter oryzae]